MNLFRSDLFSDLRIFSSSFKIQELTVFLVTSFINFGVTNQEPHVSFNFVVEDSMLFFSYEFADIRFCEISIISEAISYYGAQAFSLHSPRVLYFWSHVHLLAKPVKIKIFDILLDT